MGPTHANPGRGVEVESFERELWVLEAVLVVICGRDGGRHALPGPGTARYPSRPCAGDKGVILHTAPVTECTLRKRPSYDFMSEM